MIVNKWQLAMLLDADKEPDEALILACQRADGTPALQLAVFNELYRRHAIPVNRFFQNRIHTSELASDLAQDVWTAVWRSLPTLQLRAKFRHWLIGTADNILSAHFKKSPSRQTSSLVEEVEDPRIEIDLERKRSKELTHRFRKCLHRLGERMQLIVRRRLRGVPHNDIAKELGLSAGYVRTSFSEAREQLKACLQKDDMH